MELIQQCYHYLFWGALVFSGSGPAGSDGLYHPGPADVGPHHRHQPYRHAGGHYHRHLAYLLGEDYLADVAIVYVVLSFIAVMLLCRIYINLYQRKRQDKKEDESHDR